MASMTIARRNTLPTASHASRNRWPRRAGSVNNDQKYADRPSRASFTPSRSARNRAIAGWRMSRNLNGPSAWAIRSSHMRRSTSSNMFDRSGLREAQQHGAEREDADQDQN